MLVEGPFFLFINFLPERAFICIHTGRISIICSKPPFIANPGVRTWVQVVYLGGDTSKHSAKEERVRQEGEKSIKAELLNWFALWATRAQLRSLWGKFGEIVKE